MSESQVRISLRQQQDYRFEIDFGAGVPALVGDEQPPLGGGSGPNPVQLLAAAVGNCLSDSLLFALRKFKQAPEPISTEVTADIGRNAEGRLRVLGLEVRLQLGVPADALLHLDRVLDQFENFCTVASSVSQAIPVRVAVFDATGRQLK
jgi:uncharacterized OsmC-like protein